MKSEKTQTSKSPQSPTQKETVKEHLSADMLRQKAKEALARGAELDRMELAKKAGKPNSK